MTIAPMVRKNSITPQHIDKYSYSHACFVDKILNNVVIKINASRQLNGFEIKTNLKKKFLF